MTAGMLALAWAATIKILEASGYLQVPDGVWPPGIIMMGCLYAAIDIALRAAQALRGKGESS